MLANVSPARTREALEEASATSCRLVTCCDRAGLCRFECGPFAAILSSVDLPLPVDKKRQAVRFVKRYGNDPREFERGSLAPHLIVDASALLGEDVPARAATYERFRDKSSSAIPEVHPGPVDSMPKTFCTHSRVSHRRLAVWIVRARSIF